jgi:ABC-type polysaccharide/polyol phosphate export permease
MDAGEWVFTALGSRMIERLTAIWKFRHFLFALVRLDLRLRYRRSILGVGWSLLNPIAMTVVFAVVFSQLLGGGRLDIYIPHLLIGMAVWGFLKEAATQGCRALINNESYIRQSPLPFEIYTLRTILGLGIHSFIALAVAVAVTILLRETALFAPPEGTVRAPGPHTVLWTLVPGIVLALFASWAVATIFAFINVYFQDTQHLLDVIAQILFFLTPIFYPRSVLDQKGLAWVVDLNPANLYLELIRAPMLSGEPPGMSIYGSAVILTTVLVGMAAGTTVWLQKKVIFHL